MIVLLPIVGLTLGVLTTLLLKIDRTEYSNLVVNLFFLIGCLALIRAFQFSREELGLRVVRRQVGRHVTISLVVFTLYMLFYLFVIRISSLKPFSAAMGWGLLTNLVVVMAEELYFRGMLYGFVQKRFSARAALLVTALLFGLIHARQGVGGMLSKIFTGWLWGSVRYASDMIFLLIFPIHFAFNTVWLLFVGNWNSPPTWSIYTLPAVEFILGLAIVLSLNRRTVEN